LQEAHKNATAFAFLVT